MCGRVGEELLRVPPQWLYHDDFLRKFPDEAVIVF